MVTDMVFGTKLAATARAVNAHVAVCGSQGALRSALDERSPRLVIVDLEASVPDVNAVIREAVGHACGPTVLAYGPHVDVAAAEAATQAGAHLVWPRSRFSARLTDLLSDPAGAQGSR